MDKYFVNPEIPYFGEEGMACSESTLKYLIENGALDLPPKAVKMMSGLHGYMNGEGDRGAFCGAVNAGVAALGSVFGRTDPGQDNSLLYRLTEEFISRFEEEFSSHTCRGLAGPTQGDRETNQGKCACYVLWAASKVTELIDREKENFLKSRGRE